MNRTLRFYSTGDDVSKLQQGLNQLTSVLPKLSVDGIYGAKTVGRVKEFQRNKSLVSDGVVGQYTWAVLLSLLPQLLDPPVQPVKVDPFKGVDSQAPATDKIGSSGKLLHTWVREHYPSTSFWGRYISGNPFNTKQLTREECAILHKNDFSILFIYNGTNDGTSKLQGESNGTKHAQNAIRAMNNLLIPKPGEISAPHPIMGKVFIYANIEKNVDGAWILGWWNGLKLSNYGAGIYYSINISIPFCDALRRAAERGNPAISTALFRTDNLPLPNCKLEKPFPLPLLSQVITQYHGRMEIVPGGVTSIDHCSAMGAGSTLWR